MDRLRKMTEQPSDPQTTLRLDQHLNTGSTGSCFNKVGMCVEVSTTASNAAFDEKGLWWKCYCINTLYFNTYSPFSF